MFRYFVVPSMEWTPVEPNRFSITVGCESPPWVAPNEACTHLTNIDVMSLEHEDEFPTFCNAEGAYALSAICKEVLDSRAGF